MQNLQELPGYQFNLRLGAIKHEGILLMQTLHQLDSLAWSEASLEYLRSLRQQGRAVNRKRKNYLNIQENLLAQNVSTAEITEQFSPMINDAYEDIIRLNNELNDFLQEEGLVARFLDNRVVVEPIDEQPGEEAEEHLAPAVEVGEHAAVQPEMEAREHVAVQPAVEAGEDLAPVVEEVRNNFLNNSENILVQIEIPLVRYPNFYSSVSSTTNFISNLYRGIRPELQVQYRINQTGIRELYIGINCDFNLNFSTKNYDKSKLVGIRCHNTIGKLCKIQTKNNSHFSISLGQACCIKTKQISLHGNFILENKIFKKENLSFEFQLENSSVIYFSKNNLFLTLKPVLSYEVFPFLNNLQDVSCNKLENKSQNSTLPFASISHNQNSTISNANVGGFRVSAETVHEFAPSSDVINSIPKKQEMMIGIDPNPVQALHPKVGIRGIKAELLVILLSAGFLFVRWIRTKINKNL